MRASSRAVTEFLSAIATGFRFHNPSFNNSDIFLPGISDTTTHQAGNLAESIHVPARRINEIVLQKRGITADTSLRLSRFFGNSAQFWMNLQTRYELELARDLSASTIDRQVRPHAAA